MQLMSLVGYRAAHLIDEVPFRCVVCEHLTKHASDSIIPHMVAAHNIPAAELSIDKDGNVFHEPTIEKDPRKYN